MIVAGASLGYNTSCSNITSGKSTTIWTQCVDDHIEISYALHLISQIIVIDHMSCGAYKYQLNDKKPYTNKYDEIRAHVKQLNDFRTTINAKYTKEDSTVNPPTQIPKYTVKTLLMRLDGTVDINPTYWRPTKVSFKLNKNDIVVIGIQTLSSSLGLTSVGNLPLPETTLQVLKYRIDFPLNESTELMSLVNFDANNTWYIQNSVDASGFKSAETFFMQSVFNFRLQLVDSLAYIKLSIDTPDPANETTIRYTFESADYF